MHESMINNEGRGNGAAGLKKKEPLLVDDQLAAIKTIGESFQSVTLLAQKDTRVTTNHRSWGWNCLARGEGEKKKKKKKKPVCDFKFKTQTRQTAANGSLGL